MGIKDFLKIEYENKEFADFGIITTYSELEGRSVIVDALNIIYRSMFVSKGNLLTSELKRTHHILITLNQILRFEKYNIYSHWVFDSGKVHDMKLKCVEKRRQSQKQQNLDPLTKEEINDIKKVLKLLGVSFTTVSVEAEFFAADICSAGNMAGVISSDTDILARGGTILIPKSIDGKSKLLKISTEDIMRETKLTKIDIQNIAVIMGCDFCEKTPRIGKKSVIKKFKKIVLTEQQERALDLFSEKIIPKDVIIECSETERDVEKLKDWLISLNFGEQTLKKL